MTERARYAARLVEAPALVKERAPAAAGALPFERTGPFRLVRRLGQGGFAPVYLAEEVHDGRKLREVAIKLFFTANDGAASPMESAAFRDRVLDEARALCRVEHANVVRFHAVHRDDATGVLGLVMEHVAGEGLDVRLRAQGKLDDREVLDAGIALAWALAAVHDAGLVHGDVKPSNVIGGASGYKLIDFGIAADLAPAKVDGTVIGTPGYLAPERLERGAPPSAATDLYALGVTLHRLRTGAMPSVAAAEQGAVAPASPAGVTATFDALAAEETRTPAGAPTRPAGRTDRDDGGNAPETSSPRDDLDHLIHLLLAADPNVRPRHAAWFARELLALRAVRDGAARAEEPSTLRTVTARSIPSIAAPATSLPHPTLLHHPPLVGRDAARATIAAAATRASEGHLQVTLIRGPLGAGRTRLLDAAIDAAGAPESRVLRGACSPERQSSLLPLARALEAVPRGRAAKLSAVEEAVEEALAPRTLRDARDARAVVEAVEEALLWAAGSEPLVLAVDDAQWGDPYTLALLALLCDRAHAGGEGHLFVVITARDEPRPPAPLRALLAAARSRPDGATVTITLGPLPPDDLARVAEGVGPLSPDLARAVVRGSGGVPFFLVHALFAWRDTGAIALHEGAFRAADPAKLEEGVPGVADLVEARLASAFEADPAAGRVALRALAAVALYGGVALETLLAVCSDRGGDPEAVEAALETLVDMQLLVVRGPRCEHTFAQEMIRQAVRNLVRAKPWFSRLHRALLDALAAGPESQVDAAFLAAGYDELGDSDEARKWLRFAMDRAFAAGLLAEAVTMGDRRAALAHTAAERVDAQLATIRALLAARRFEDADVRLRLMKAETSSARDVPTPSGAPNVASSNDVSDVTAPSGAPNVASSNDVSDVTAPSNAHAAMPPMKADLHRRVLALETARGLHLVMDDATLLPAVDASGDLALRCDARMALAGALGGRRALGLAAEAVTLAETGDPAIEYGTRVGRAELIYASDERDLALAHRDLTRALAIAEARASRLHRLQIESDLAAVEAEQGDVDAAIDRFARLADEADARGMRGERRRLVQNRAALLLRQGRALEAAEAAAEAARLSREAGDPVLCASAWSIRADALRRAGDLPAARLAIDEALHLQEERGDRMRALSLLRRAEIAHALGDLEAAAADAALAGTLARASGDRWIAVAADLWDTLHRARLGAATPADLERALTEAAAPDVAPRGVVRSLVARARAWLHGDPPPDTR